MLEAIQLTKSYQQHPALKGLNLTINAGEIFCLLGANGAGKTTTINLFMNFIQPTSGEVKVNGLNVVTQARETKKYLAYIPESLNLYPHLTGLENLQIFVNLGEKQLDKNTLESLLVATGLPQEAVRKRVAHYSKGMRQKVGIAIAKAKEADNLLLDEPTSGLDPQASNDFAVLLQQMQAKGVATLMATHDLFRAREVGTHIGIMRAGELVHVLKSEDISLNELEKLYIATMKTTAHA